MGHLWDFAVEDCGCHGLYAVGVEAVGSSTCAAGMLNIGFFFLGLLLVLHAVEIGRAHV